MTPPPPHLHVGIGVWGAENYDITTTFYDFFMTFYDFFMTFL